MFGLALGLVVAELCEAAEAEDKRWRCPGLGVLVRMASPMTLPRVIPG